MLSLSPCYTTSMKNVRRLYDQFKPDHYILDLIPNSHSMTFKGTVIISGHKVGRPSQRLMLHQKGLTVTAVHMTHHDKKGDTEVEVDRTNMQASFDELRLHAKHMLYPGRYTVSISFEGAITKNMNGMYPCFFTHDGKEKMLIATQFESHHAREVFPCIDEPEAKATFDLSLTTPKDLTVIANTPVKKQISVGDEIRTSFETTPKMSTYLLAFVYGEMGYKEATTKDGVVVRTYATPDNVKFTDFALKTAVQCLEFYNEYFGIDYPLEKCDMVALPDFASGAMENWGCITYREQALLVDPANTSLASKQYVAMVVAHELTHQWFGNLVTMRWWTDLWLNEGFATWFEYLAVDHLYPNWKMWTQFMVDEQQRALNLDALEHTHPVEVPVHHPDEIRTIFDSISYSKGASVIHMLYHYLGETAFQAGLQYYLKKHAHKNTDTVDLWEALETVSDKPVRTFMHAWTSQSGYPLVSATIEGDDLTISQNRMLVNPLSKHTSDTKWPIPLLTGHTTLPAVMDKQKVTLEGASLEKLMLNRGGSGFYRTVYNASHMERLGQQVKHGHLDVLNRLGLLADAFEAAKAGLSDTGEVLHMLAYYENEDDNAVWDVIASGLGNVRAIMDDDTIREDMKPFVRKLIAIQLKRLGWEAKPRESHFDKLLRPTILAMASVADEPSIVKHALALFEGIKVDEKKKTVDLSAIDPDLRGIVYGTAARHGGEAAFNKLLTMHNISTFSEERLNYCAALCGFKETKLVKRALALIDTPEVRLQDTAYWLAYSFSNRYARKLTWEWMIKHWSWLEDNLGKDLSFFRMPMYVARGFSDKDFLPEFKKFFNSVMSPAFERSINQGIETIQWQADWKERDQKTVRAFFKA